MTERLTVAVAGFAALPHTLEARLAAAERRIADAAAAGARLLTLPQRLLAGDGPDLEAAGFLSDAPPLRALGAAARRHGVALACGYLEHCSGRIHDAALFVAENGLAVANYRRTHLDPGTDPAELAPGHWLNLVRHGPIRFGLLMGADLLGPEPARALALAGAAVLLVPAGQGSDPGGMAEALLRARAFENGCGLLFANAAAGKEGPPSRIVGPDGAVLAAVRDGIAVAELPLRRGAAAERRIGSRRPPLYHRLTLPHPPADLPRA